MEEDDIGVQTSSMMDQAAFNVTLSSDPGDLKTFCKAMGGKGKLNWELPAQSEANNFLVSRCMDEVSQK